MPKFAVVKLWENARACEKVGLFVHTPQLLEILHVVKTLTNPQFVYSKNTAYTQAQSPKFNQLYSEFCPLSTRLSIRTTTFNKNIGEL